MTASRASSDASGDQVGRRVAVYCGSSTGHADVFAATAAELGRTLAGRGHGLVYGGGHVGLMGIVADASLAAGGEVIGVMTADLVRAEIAHSGLTDLVIVDTMHERKARMTELVGGVVVLPGGFGTLDEAFEALTWNQLGIVAVPVVFLDVAGYFGPLLEFLDAAVDHGFVRAAHRDLVRRAGTVAEALDALLAPTSPVSPKWGRPVSGEAEWEGPAWEWREWDR